MNREKLRAGRKTKVPPSQQGRRKLWPLRVLGPKYDPTSLQHVIRAAVAKANAKDLREKDPGVPLWHVYPLSHNDGTRILAELWWKVAKTLLGN
jgi:hypothetical protein